MGAADAEAVAGMKPRLRDFPSGLRAGPWEILGRAFPGGRGSARRYRVRCRSCATERVLTHFKLSRLIAKDRAGLAPERCPACPALNAKRIWDGPGFWHPAAACLPPGIVPAASAWPTVRLL